MRSALRREYFFKAFEAVTEDVGDISLNEVLVDDRRKDPAARAVVHGVGTAGGVAIGCWFEAVGVVPEGVGARVLVVDELVGWVPVEDCSFPFEWNASDLELVADHGARLHVDRSRGEHIELEEIRSECLQIVRISEEREDLVERTGEGLGSDELPDRL